MRSSVRRATARSPITIHDIMATDLNQEAQMSDSKNPVGRRGFLKRAAAGGAGLAATAPIALAQQAALKPATGSTIEVTSSVRPGSDFMVDVFKTLGIEYIAANPGSSFRGLQESFINYGKNTSPEW